MITIKNLEYRYPKSRRQVFKNLNLCIGDGKIHGLLGMNGAGKSTLLYLMSSLLLPTSGAIEVVLRDNLHLHSYSYEIFSELFAFLDDMLFCGGVVPVSFYIMFGIMCGSIWTKRALPKSIGLGIAITMILLAGMTVWGVLLAMLPQSARQFYYDISGILIFISLLLLNVLMACIAYKVFVNRQVTEQKPRHMLMSWK